MNNKNKNNLLERKKFLATWPTNIDNSYPQAAFHY